MIRSGVVGVPAGIRDALGEGSWPLLTADGVQIGNLVCRGGSVWGLGRYFRRRGADVDDIMILEIDRKTAVATIRLGGPEILEQSREDLNLPLDLPDDT
jgi:hypothetical protein